MNNTIKKHTPTKRKAGRIKMVLVIGNAIILLVVLVTVYSSYHIRCASEDKLYSDCGEIPANKVGLILGTSKYLAAGGINPYFSYRIDAAVELYRKGKVEYLLASGDNSLVSYNEPKYIYRELLEKGVPEEKIYLDYAGFRTLDSVVRCKDVFGQESVTIISQEFHNMRAVFIAGHYDIDAVGYSARGVSSRMGLKVMTRELFAKVKAMLDVYVFRTQPKYLGDNITIP
ncbi:MAG: ElyC/SanA/YdcF family protein [Spirochaetia bacterium]